MPSTALRGNENEISAEMSEANREMFRREAKTRVRGLAYRIEKIRQLAQLRS